MRGRLIQRFVARIAKLDRDSQRLAEHYDDDFKEPVLVDNGDRIGTIERAESLVEVPCQVKPVMLDKLAMLAGGNSPHGQFIIILHFKDLEAKGLVCDNGLADFHAGDRLCALLSTRGLVELQFEGVQRLYLTENKPIGWGLSMTHARRNLLLLRFEERKEAGQRFE